MFKENFENPKFHPDENGMVRLSEIAISLNKQSKSLCDFVHGLDGVPNLGEGLRTEGEPGEYPDIKIHIDDVETFIQRYHDWEDEESKT